MGKWLIAEWREAWRFSSLWVGTLAIAVLAAWDMVPAELRDGLLGRYKVEIGVVLWIALIVSRISRQPWSQASIDAKRAGVRALAESRDNYADWEDNAHG